MVGIRQRGEEPLWAMLRGSRVNAELRAARERAEAMLETVGLIDRARESARDLSFGEQRFLSIARSLVGNPYLVLMDEPTVGLDRSAFGKLLALMNLMVERDRKALLVIEHNMDMVMSVSAKIVLMVQGTVVASGLPEEIRQNRSMVEAYLGTRHAARSF
jgi:ABC-type branched-subunit amino acid transport system ATPase component